MNHCSSLSLSAATAGSSKHENKEVFFLLSSRGGFL